MFNVRVYGILFNAHQDILLVDEVLDGFAFTKFPGGGLEFGEGPEETVVREFQEECGVEVTCEKHIYTTGFFQASAFNPKQQIISIYYQVSCINPDSISLQTRLVNLQSAKNHKLSCRWASLKSLRDTDFTFPIDRHVFKILLNGQ